MIAAPFEGFREPGPASAAGPAPALGWLSLHEASRRSRLGIRTLQRRCVEEWAPQGKARKVSPRPGVKRSWQIHEQADVAFSRVKFPEQIGTDLRDQTESARSIAFKRKAMLDDWHKCVEAGFARGLAEIESTSHFVASRRADGQMISRRTLYDWESRFRKEGLRGLLDQRTKSKKQDRSKTDDPFLQDVKRYYLTPRKLKLTVCREIAMVKAQEEGWDIRSYKSCQRFINSLPRVLVLQKREGEEAYVNEAEPYIERDYSTLESNELLVGDHHQFDVIVNAGGQRVRPWLTAWMDMRSRKIVGHAVYANDPNSDTILRALDLAIRSHGVPRGVVIDNGKDYDSYALNGRTKRDRWQKRSGKVQLDVEHAKGIFAALEIEPHFCWAYHGQSKPIERFFGTVELATPTWPTYCGRSTAEKPEDLQLQLERGNAPTVQAFSDWFDAWLAKYHKTPHTGDSMDGRTPAEVFEACLTTRRTASDELLDVLLLRPTKPVKIGQNGVTYQGLRYGANDDALIGRLGDEVVLRVDDRDLTTVQVWTLDGKFITLAKANQRIPANADSQKLREAIVVKRGARRLLREYADRRPRLADDLPDLLALACAAEQRPDNPPPPTLSPIRSPLEDQLPAVRRAKESVQLRKAVGAEGMENQSGKFIYEGSSSSEAEPPLEPFRYEGVAR